LSGTASGGSGSGYSFAWSGNGTPYLSSIGNFSNTETAIFNTATAGTYSLTLTVTDDNGCTGSKSSTITVKSLPTASISVSETSGNANNDGIICDGASVTLTASGGTSYSWDNSLGTAQLKLLTLHLLLLTL